ncbi:winged helix-turn-helix domain-containing protein [Brevibacillus laterosporus]|uniref:winged helix-turn-helix domain-containing protein n=1 Tax=Brevibacillus laterosporus TaxID=1465 RepID=UPI0003B2124D|nr:hypothetical protein P615_07015 [Brevibacillus laterosporus PE36]
MLIFEGRKEGKYLLRKSILSVITLCLMRRNGVEIELTKKEFDIIELLATNPGQVFSKEQIFEKIWGYDSDRMLRR